MMSLRSLVSKSAICFGLSIASGIALAANPVSIQVLFPQSKSSQRGKFIMEVSAVDTESPDGRVQEVVVEGPVGKSSSHKPPKFIVDTSGWPDGTHLVRVFAIGFSEKTAVSELVVSTDNFSCRNTPTVFEGLNLTLSSKYEYEAPITITGTEHPAEFELELSYPKNPRRLCLLQGVDLISPAADYVELDPHAFKAIGDRCVFKERIKRFSYSSPVAVGSNVGKWILGFRTFPGSVSEAMSISQNCAAPIGSWEISRSNVALNARENCQHFLGTANGKSAAPVQFEFQSTHPRPEALEVTVQYGAVVERIRNSDFRVSGSSINFSGAFSKFQYPFRSNWKICFNSLDGLTYPSAKVNSWKLSQ